MSYSRSGEGGFSLQRVEDPAPLAEKKSNRERRADIVERYRNDFIEVNPERENDGVAETFHIQDTVQRDYTTKNYHTNEPVAAAVDAVVVLGEGKDAPYFKCLAAQAEDMLAEAQERYRHSKKTLAEIANELR